MRLSKVVFSIWIFFWLFFLVRGLYKGRFENYKTLLSKNPEEKRAYVIGEELYKFLEFSLKNIPRKSTYKIIGSLKPIDRYRIIYYLYPRRESDSPEYVLCYKMNEDYSKKEDFYKLTTLKSGQFILKRR